MTYPRRCCTSSNNTSSLVEPLILLLLSVIALGLFLNDLFSGIQVLYQGSRASRAVVLIFLATGLSLLAVWIYRTLAGLNILLG